MNSMNRNAYRATEIVGYALPVPTKHRVYSSLPNYGKQGKNKQPPNTKEEKNQMPFPRENKAKMARDIFVLILGTCRYIFRGAATCSVLAKNTIHQLKLKWNKDDYFIESEVRSDDKDRLANDNILGIVKKQIDHNTEELKTEKIFKRKDVSPSEQENLGGTPAVNTDAEHLSVIKKPRNVTNTSNMDQDNIRITLHPRTCYTPVLKRKADNKVKNLPGTTTNYLSDEIRSHKHQSLKITLKNSNITGTNITDAKTDRLSVSEKNSGSYLMSRDGQRSLQILLTKIFANDIKKEINDAKEGHLYIKTTKPGSHIRSSDVHENLQATPSKTYITEVNKETISADVLDLPLSGMKPTLEKDVTEFNKGNIDVIVENVPETTTHDSTTNCLRNKYPLDTPHDLKITKTTTDCLRDGCNSDMHDSLQAAVSSNYVHKLDIGNTAYMERSTTNYSSIYARSYNLTQEAKLSSKNTDSKEIKLENTSKIGLKSEKLPEQDTNKKLIKEREKILLASRKSWDSITYPKNHP